MSGGLNQGRQHGRVTVSPSQLAAKVLPMRNLRDFHRVQDILVSAQAHPSDPSVIDLHPISIILSCVEDATTHAD